ncbi:MAG TPA: 2-dehydropantoate 2-reductase N-terminal domain-containing protein [Polyangiaceae bacterium]
MKIAIVGAGRIGSTVGFHLARGGHDVTLVARGKRLEELQSAKTIEAVNGDRADVKAAAALDEKEPWDLVVVTVLAHQVGAVLPALGASKAKHVMFMFNTFEKLDRLRDAVGGERFTMAFPNMTAFFVDGKLKSQVKGPGMVTTLGDDRWAKVFAAAGLPTEVRPDMESFLRSHAAFVAPMMVAANLAYPRNGGITWAEAKELARAMDEAFAVVKGLGNTLVPGFVAAMAKMPTSTLAFMLWSTSRAAVVRDLGAFGPTEARELIDAFVAVAPDATKTLQAVRP